MREPGTLQAVLRWGRGVAVAALLGAIGAGAARADVIIPDPQGTKRVAGTIEVDWGVFANRVSRRHVVVEGDTLRKLAKTYLGDAERWQDIAADNRGTLADANVLKIGTDLWIPPATTSTADEPRDPETGADLGGAVAPRYVAFWSEAQDRWDYRLVARAGPGELPGSRRNGARLVLVRSEHAGPALEALAKGEHPRPPGVSGSTLVVFLYPDTLVAADDPAIRVVSHFRLTGVQNSLVRVDATRKRYGADGKRVTEVFEYEGRRGAQPEAPPDDEPSGSDAGKKPDPPARDAGGDDDGKKDDGAVRVLRDIPPPDDAPARWSKALGIAVALLGLVVVVGVALARRRSPPGS